MSLPLAAKAALVTGGSRGIGAAVARRFAREGAAVAITYSKSSAQADALVAELRAAGHKAAAIKADAANPAELTGLVARAAAALGAPRIDILVNNAGVFEVGPLADAPESLYDQVFGVNVKAVWLLLREAAAELPDGGRIINISSVVGQVSGFAGVATYAASKHAVEGLTKGLARDLAGRRILVNSVSPGPIDTEMNPASGPMAGAMTSMVPLGRFGTAEEVAAAVSFFAGPESGYITGTTLLVDGGMTA